MSDFKAIPAARHVWRSLMGNKAYAFHLSWPWLAVLLAVQTAFSLQTRMLLDSVKNAQNTGDGWFNFIAIFVVLIMVLWIAYSSIALNWHRYILLNDETEGWLRLRIDRPVWSYLGNSLLLMLLFLLLAFLAGFCGWWIPQLLKSTLGDGMAFAVIIFVGCSIALYVYTIFMRLAIKLPAVALGRSDYGFGNALEDSSGSTLGLVGFFAVFLLMVLAVGVAVGIVLFLPVFALNYLFGTENILVLLFSNVVQVIANWVGMMFGVNVLTTLYGIFVEGREV